MTNLNDKLSKLPARRREQIEQRTKELIAEEMALRELRKAVDLTQERMAELLGIGQEGVSRIEKRCDLLVSTLRSYIGAMGGTLRLVAELPDRPPVELSGFGNIAAISATEQVSQRVRHSKGG